MSPKEIFSQLSLWIGKFDFNSPFASVLSYTGIYNLHVWIRIRMRNTDPNPQSSWKRIRIYNTAMYCSVLFWPVVLSCHASDQCCGAGLILTGSGSATGYWLRLRITIIKHKFK